MTPVQLITFAKSRIEKIGRATGNSVVGTAEGDNSRDYDSEVFATHGIVSRPSKKTRGIRIRIGNLGFVIAAFTYGVEPPENEGAVKMYSTDADGVEKSALTLDSDGKAYMGNSETNWATLYFELLDILDKFDTAGNSVAQRTGPATKNAIAEHKANAQKLIKESL